MLDSVTAPKERQGYFEGEGDGSSLYNGQSFGEGEGDCHGVMYDASARADIINLLCQELPTRKIRKTSRV